MTSPSKTAVTNAQDPFSGDPGTDFIALPPDFILRTSDVVDFHVHRDILKLVSHFFHGMFSFPGGDSAPDQLIRDGKPVLVLPESSEVLYRVLSLAYPPQSIAQYLVTCDYFDGLVAAHSAAHKYQFVGVQKIMEEMLDDPILLDAHPYRVFAIARLWGLPYVARKAALATLKYPLSPTMPEFPEMELLPWADANKLQRFHQSCGVAAREIVHGNCNSPGATFMVPGCPKTFIVSVTDDTALDASKVWAWWLPMHGTNCQVGIPQLVHVNLFTYSQTLLQSAVPWFRKHMTELGFRLSLSPSPDVVADGRDIAAPERAVINSCHTCACTAYTDLAVFLQKLKRDMEDCNDSIVRKYFE
ncbi:hypothetical protein FB45DRAFT_835483 [Roridomyces roridus]|uniref:BTB domain-containing protein n=1 Tax=Roridomyces roridus TaxID=1738132 RepID=A0AAD7BQ07_9AGAR|nr:hypothetical protein FB45DRAFT_835483 [Roridomyces roridus]